MNYDDFCLKCIYKNYALERGIFCKLTNAIPDFDVKCVDFYSRQELEQLSPYELIKKSKTATGEFLEAISAQIDKKGGISRLQEEINEGINFKSLSANEAFRTSDVEKQKLIEQVVSFFYRDKPEKAFDMIQHNLQKDPDDLLLLLASSYCIALLLDYDQITFKMLQNNLMKLIKKSFDGLDFHFSQLFTILTRRHLHLSELYQYIKKDAYDAKQQIEVKDTERMHKMVYVFGISGILATTFFGAKSKFYNNKIPCLYVPAKVDQSELDRIIKEASTLQNQRIWQAKKCYQVMMSYEEYLEKLPSDLVENLRHDFKISWIEKIIPFLKETFHELNQKAIKELVALKNSIRSSPDKFRSIATMEKLAAVSALFNFVKAENVKLDKTTFEVETFLETLKHFLSGLSADEFKEFSGQAETLQKKRKPAWIIGIAGGSLIFLELFVAGWYLLFPGIILFVSSFFIWDHASKYEPEMAKKIDSMFQEKIDLLKNISPDFELPVIGIEDFLYKVCSQSE